MAAETTGVRALYEQLVDHIPPKLVGWVTDDGAILTPGYEVSEPHRTVIVHKPGGGVARVVENKAHKRRVAALQET